MTPKEETEFVQSLQRGDPVAVAKFETEFLTPLHAQLAHMKLDAAMLDEVRQAVRARLLLPHPDGPARIEAYAGQGKLAGLVYVTATRIAVDLLRAQRARESHVAEVGESLAEAGGDWLAVSTKNDPALASLKTNARLAFKAAVEEAVSGLEVRERNLLRQHHLQGVSLDRLAQMYQVHRATVVRWLALAREKVLAQTRKRLAVELVATGSELDSVLALLESQLDASVERLLRSQSE